MAIEQLVQDVDTADAASAATAATNPGPPNAAPSVLRAPHSAVTLSISFNDCTSVLANALAPLRAVVSLSDSCS
ncbi:hypothetical protein HN018_22820 (plasmid) [Lichenicola cladoniae]|uniref:Uncharacterized protein n=1 Tax=Lichenicola cladoniae TaxID=1484109 RepID=A0A6M8HXX2_9PROT|nr:hypothetical protein [Lichenicola cladoniae]NPD68653.1 hypothetical protein [Acetobacteraceae bacterium]QKE93035.1 hypothetical protein HN018_22820 [Lichenicola cladoniae]